MRTAIQTVIFLTVFVALWNVAGLLSIVFMNTYMFCALALLLIILCVMYSREQRR